MDSKEKANHFRIYSNDMIENMKLYLNNEKKFITFPKFVFYVGQLMRKENILKLIGEL